VQAWVRRAFWDVVPRDHRDTPGALRRRQVVVAVFIVIGAVVLGLSLRIDPGDPAFYPATFGLAAVWVVGALVSGRLHLGRTVRREAEVRPWGMPIAIGLALALVFVVGGLVVREIPFVVDQVRTVLDHADQGNLVLLIVITAANGVAEELFFRGAVYAAIPKYPVVWTTVAYFVATLATGNVLLSFAAIILGVLVGLQRRASGGILAPILTHVTWSLSMLVVLPLVFVA
jgi:membrane protease YdiL (CAAX protease family)